MHLPRKSSIDNTGIRQFKQKKHENFQKVYLTRAVEQKINQKKEIPSEKAQQRLCNYLSAQQIMRMKVKLKRRKRIKRKKST